MKTAQFDDLVDEILTLVKRHAYEEIERTFLGQPKPAKVQTKKSQKRGGMSTKVYEYIVKHPGSTGKQILAGLGWASGKGRLLYPREKLRAAKLIRTEGTKRNMKYYATSKG